MVSLPRTSPTLSLVEMSRQRFNSSDVYELTQPVQGSSAFRSELNVVSSPSMRNRICPAESGMLAKFFVLQTAYFTGPRLCLAFPTDTPAKIAISQSAMELYLRVVGCRNVNVYAMVRIRDRYLAGSSINGSLMPSKWHPRH